MWKLLVAVSTSATLRAEVPVNKVVVSFVAAPTVSDEGAAHVGFVAPCVSILPAVPLSSHVGFVAPCVSILPGDPLANSAVTFDADWYSKLPADPPITLVALVALPDSAPLNVPQVIMPVPPDPTVSEGTDGLTTNCLSLDTFEYSRPFMTVPAATGDVPDSAYMRYLSTLPVEALVILTVLAEVALPDSAPLNVVQ